MNATEENRTIEENPKVQRHMDICMELNETYAKKNHDYGDSFHETWKEEAYAMARIRLSDKLNRFKKLSRNAAEGMRVSDESMRDTLLDLANYAIMTVMEMDIQEEEDARDKIKKAISEHRKAYLPENSIDSGEFVCPNCGNKLTFSPKINKYLCGGCGTMLAITRTAAVQRGDTDTDPCEKCTYPAKETCGGCMDRVEWELRQRGDIDAAEAEQADGR